MDPTVKNLYDQFKNIEDNYGLLLQRCASEDEKEKLRAAYTQAWRNYNQAINKTFREDDPAVAELRAQIALQTTEVQDALHGLQAMAKTLDTIARCVALGSKLVGAIT